MIDAPKHIVIANFGNESIALIQWCLEQQVNSLLVLSVDTGWQAQQWQQRVDKAHQWLNKNAVDFKRLDATHSMSDCVRERGHFPNKKLQWCAGFLKGLALNDYLDEIDPSCESTLLFAKRKESSRANRWLEERLQSEHFNGRQVWHPILAVTNVESAELLKRAGFDYLMHQSLECMPCIHASSHLFKVMSADDMARLSALESEIGEAMFEAPIKDYVSNSKPENSGNFMEQLDMGCGSEFGCGE